MAEMRIMCDVRINEEIEMKRIGAAGAVNRIKYQIGRFACAFSHWYVFLFQALYLYTNIVQRMLL